MIDLADKKNEEENADILNKYTVRHNYFNIPRDINSFFKCRCEPANNTKIESSFRHYILPLASQAYLYNRNIKEFGKSIDDSLIKQTTLIGELQKAIKSPETLVSDIFLEPILKKMQTQIDSLSNINKAINKAKIKELLSRDELKEHTSYAFRNLICTWINNNKRFNLKKDSETNEFFIFGSALNFITKTVNDPIDNISMDGLSLGLKRGLRFKLSILSPIHDSKDRPRVRAKRTEAARTIADIAEIRDQAVCEDWSGCFELSATSQINYDSFSSIAIEPNRRISVLAVSGGIEVANSLENVFETPIPSKDVTPKCLPDELFTVYQERYQDETWPLLRYNYPDKNLPEINKNGIDTIVLAFEGNTKKMLCSSDDDFFTVRFGYTFNQISLNTPATPEDKIKETLKEFIKKETTSRSTDNDIMPTVYDVVFGGRINENMTMLYFARVREKPNNVLTNDVSATKIQFIMRRQFGKDGFDALKTYSAMSE